MDHLDVIIISEPNPLNERGRVETSGMASDFDWTWARFFSKEEEVPQEFVLIGGYTLEIAGREIIRSAARINHLVAKRVGQKFRLESEEGVFDHEIPIAAFGPSPFYNAFHKEDQRLQ